MQRRSLQATLVACFAISCECTTPGEVDDSVTSAIARTMASIEGGAHRRAIPSMAKKPKLGLAKLKKQEDRRTAVENQFVLRKADAPKQLAGYLGWAKASDKSFSTMWKASGKDNTQSLYMRDLNERLRKQASKPSPHKEVLVSDSVATTAFSKMLEEQWQATDVAAVDWGGKAKSKQHNANVDAALSAKRTNGYLSAVGWSTPTTVVKESENPYLQSLHEDPSKKKFLATLKVAEQTHHENSNKYFESLMPSAAEQLSMSN
mmetsp:Transcript_69156/g.109678  ORF Transcript_69156/g.109678 Transcript_69156/m.109678 type:complete len:262 (+) Transcript_69156:36-821(+)